MRNIILCFVFLLTSNSMLFSQEKTPEVLLNKFFSLYETSPEAALTYLFSTNKGFYEKNKESITTYISKYKEYLPSLGDYYGYSKAKENEVFYPALIKYSYVLNYDDIPLLYEITLYKPKDQWRLYNFTYITNYGLPKTEKKEETK